jgi:hypothetical protein
MDWSSSTEIKENEKQKRLVQALELDNTKSRWRFNVDLSQGEE